MFGNDENWTFWSLMMMMKVINDNDWWLWYQWLIWNDGSDYWECLLGNGAPQNVRQSTQFQKSLFPSVWNSPYLANPYMPNNLHQSAVIQLSYQLQCPLVGHSVCMLPYGCFVEAKHAPAYVCVCVCDSSLSCDHGYHRIAKIVRRHRS